MDVVRHNTERVKFKVVFVKSLFNRIKKDFPAFSFGESKLAIVATSRNVVGISSLKITRFSRHKSKICRLCRKIILLKAQRKSFCAFLNLS